MKCILFLTLFLTLSVVNRAQNVTEADQKEGVNKKEQEGTRAEQLVADILEGSVVKEEWTKITAALCDPTKCDDSMINAMNECVPQKNTKLGKYFISQFTNKIYEKCGKPNESDLIEYTKVKNADNKKHLMFRCSQKMKTCMKNEWKAKTDKLRDGILKQVNAKSVKKGKGEKEKDVKLQLTGEKIKKKMSETMKKITICLKKAVKLE